MRKIKFLSVFVLLALLLSAGPGAVMGQEPPPDAEEKPPSSGSVIVTVVAEPSNGDEDWPIIRIETWDYTDEVTGEVRTHRVTVREAPSSYQPPSERLECPDALGTLGYNCTYRGTQTKTDEDIVGNIHAHLKTWADKYCRDQQCSLKFYRLEKSELWWTRSDPAWWVDDATYHSGFSLCYECNTGDVESRDFNYGPFTPGWYNNTQSWVWIVDLQNWPAVWCYESLGANSESKGYRDSTYWGTMFVETQW